MDEILKQYLDIILAELKEIKAKVNTDHDVLILNVQAVQAINERLGKSEAAIATPAKAAIDFMHWKTILTIAGTAVTSLGIGWLGKILTTAGNAISASSGGP